MTIKMCIKEFLFKEQQSQEFLIAQWCFAMWLMWALLTVPIILTLIDTQNIENIPGYTSVVLPDILMTMYHSSVNYAVPIFLIYLGVSSITDGLLPGTRKFMDRFRK